MRRSWLHRDAFVLVPGRRRACSCARDIVFGGEQPFPPGARACSGGTQLIPHPQPPSRARADKAGETSLDCPRYAPQLALHVSLVKDRKIYPKQRR